MNPHDLILAAVIVALVCLRRRRAGVSDEELMDQKRLTFERGTNRPSNAE